jgi:hypothetical protein
MRLDMLPAHAATKLLQLDADARQLAEEVDKLENKIAFSRKVFFWPDRGPQPRCPRDAERLRRAARAAQRDRRALQRHVGCRRGMPQVGREAGR